MNGEMGRVGASVSLLYDHGAGEFSLWESHDVIKAQVTEILGIILAARSSWGRGRGIKHMRAMKL